MAYENEELNVEEILSNVDSFFRQDSAFARERLARLDEPSLRSLRDQRHCKLVALIPSVAGRSLTKRMPGNVAKLTDDCWAFGASIAQEVVLKEADSALKPPDCCAPVSAPQTSAASLTSSSTETANMEAILSNMLRMDKELQDLRASNIKLNQSLASQQVRIANLVDRAAR